MFKGIAKKLENKTTQLAVMGLGYVGLPLAVEFGKKIVTVGFDLKQERIDELKEHIDLTGEISPHAMKMAKYIDFTSDQECLKESLFIVVAVPSPINDDKEPDLSFLEFASEIIGKNIQKGTIVVFESTVYPGVTEDICAPIIEKYSGFKRGVDFKLGYSPERINPGDKEHRIVDILKIVSGEDEETLDEVAKVYGMIIKAGLHRAESIKVAEAAKVIENVQRDLNIAFVNELSVIFHKMNIDTQAVLEAAGTKWNFVKMKPGLVGGHCIGVDPYYLTHKAQNIGYDPQVILAGRRINDAMGGYIANQTIEQLKKAKIEIKGSRVIIFGITFKENVGDIRNSGVVDIIDKLRMSDVVVDVIDPLASKEDVKKEYGIDLLEYNKELRADAIIMAVSHQSFKEHLSPDILSQHISLDIRQGVFMDVKAMYHSKDFSDQVLYWRL